MPEYIVDTEGNVAVNTHWHLTPLEDQRHTDGGFLVFDGVKLSDKSKRKWFDRVKIEKLADDAKLDDFAINRIKDGTRAAPVDKSIAEKKFEYSQGRVISARK